MKKILTLILILNILLSYCLSQTNVDFLEIKLKTETDDSLRLEMLGELCYTFMYSDSIISSEYCIKMLSEIEKSENNYAIGNAYRTAGIFYLFYLDYENAILNFNKALEIYESIDDEQGKIGYAKTCYNYGLLFEYNADYEVELELYSKAVDIFIEYKLYNYLVSLYTRYIVIYNKLGDVEKEREYNKKVIELSSEINDEYWLMSVYLSYASSYVENANYDSAVYYFDKLKALSEKIGNTDGLGNYYYNMGYLEIKRENYQKSLELFLKAFEIAQSTENISDDLELYNQIGYCYKNLKRYDIARDTLLTGIENAQKYKFKELEGNMLETISELEAETGNFQKALEYRIEFFEVYKEYLNEEKLKQISYLEAKYEATQKENEIKKLNEENLIKELSLNKKNILIFSLLAIFTTLIIIAFFIIHQINTKKRFAEKDSELQKSKIEKLEKEHQLTAMKYALQGEETERHRISKDLHDGIGGLLSGIKLNLSYTKSNLAFTDEVAKQMDNTINQIDEAIRELRRVAHNMMPQTLVKSGLKTAVSDFCESINMSKKIKADFQYYGYDDRLDQRLEVNIYRIIQELANNTLKYANAENILIQLISDENRICLTVNDDGKGFDTDSLKTSKGMGFANIKSRVELFNGRYELSSQAGKGTEVLVEFDI